jgi:hypothetical protein
MAHSGTAQTQRRIRPLWVTHDEIATMSNCSKSLVHAELRRFEKERWLALSYGSISVLAPEPSMDLLTQ